ncbi:cytochrome b-c1 complex subunit 9 [Bradysia coprophila]|uniref:cytochrome b-c1 complex subunit 9 n=1 Tax=Bradysia coprophila TaxID=38358 RepID=UPI00187D8A49|nr:cytochrome b-c1 complex subunit 9 [Bradysia coprophila]
MSFLYNLVFKRTSTFAVGILASVFFFERGFDVAADALFESHNKGKLWNDIKHKHE